MWRIRNSAFAAATIVSVSCGLPDYTLAPQEPPPSPVTPIPSSPVGRLELTADTGGSFVGLKSWLTVAAFAIDGRRLNSNQAVVTSSNSSVVMLGDVNVIQVYQPGVRQPTFDKAQLLSMVGAGTAVIRVSLGDVTDSVTVSVRALPLASTAMVVETFTVLEYHETCSWACPYLIYAPVLRLREATGTSYADVIAVEFSVPTKTTGWCTAQTRFANGQSAHLNGFEDYPWANDLIFASLNGVPLPDGLARARVIVRDSSGTYGVLDVTAPIQRNVVNAKALLPPPNGIPWACPPQASP